ncbi:hypothetical protein [Caldicellulosiruptor acetigenus]|uniref:hypothetical protein n=1 Tax=Caldicellulosiruptor acetigenus TaxID=301953 RepID=UPI0003F9AC12|nr:hypothetical protein [Caldicellulosiruptor acetigenus]WAM36671.1 hypothetical protein OTK01_000451 [Caldicellulosiruptor acetigenus]
MDYLLRDSLYCGVEYGRYNYQRLIECLGLKESYETSDFCDSLQKKNIKVLYERLQTSFPQYDFVLLETKQRIHNFITREATDEEEAGEGFYVIRNNKPYLLSDESHVIKNMPKKFSKYKNICQPQRKKV